MLTKKNTTWALQGWLYHDVHTEIVFGAGEFVKELHEMNTGEMNYYFGRFVAEAKIL